MFKVSVLMPVYNSEKYLNESIKSILNQTLRNIEIIIIDDGSTDMSGEIIKKYADLDPRVKHIRQSNLGISKTRNKLVDLAVADYIAWMDSDDIALPNRIEKQLNYLVQNKNCVSVGSVVTMIDNENNKIFNFPVPYTHDDIDQHHLRGNGGAMQFPSTLMRKDAVIKAGGFNEKLIGAEDLCLLIRLAEIGQLANLPESLYYYRQHNDSISHEKSEIIYINKCTVLEEAAKRRNIKLNIQTKPTYYKKEEQDYKTFSKWAWWAISGKNLNTSFKYTLKCVKAKPLRINTWKLIYCLIRSKIETIKTTNKKP